MKMFLLILSLHLFAASLSWGSTTREKFNALVTSIETELANYGGQENQIDSLANGGLRQSLFSIQTLADLYSVRYTSLYEVRTSTKQLEDAIGAYRKTTEQYAYAQQAGASAEQLKVLKERQEYQKQSLLSFLSSAGWVQGTALSRLKNILKQTPWQSSNSDQKYSYSALATQVGKMEVTNWDMTVLEGGVGIHDLRKAVRWYSLEVKALNDLIGTQNQTCDQGAVLPSNPASGGKCIISACLHSQMLKIYDVFGAIKDIGEGQDGIGGHIPPEKLQEAADLYADTRQKQTFKKLTEEFNACANALPTNGGKE